MNAPRPLAFVTKTGDTYVLVDTKTDEKFCISDQQVEALVARRRAQPPAPAATMIEDAMRTLHGIVTANHGDDALRVKAADALLTVLRAR